VAEARRAASISALILLVVALAQPALAQQRRQVLLGGIIGYSRAEFIGDDATASESRTSTLAGAFVRIPLASWFSLEPELLFARKGGASKATPAQPTSTAFDIVYLETPLLARFTGPRMIKILRLLAFAGPSAGFKIGCDIETDQAGSNTRTPCDDQLVASVDYSAVFGGGLEARVGNSALGLEVRYSYGLKKLLGDGTDVRNGQLGILAEIPF
jgi:hypothetical protein